MDTHNAIAILASQIGKQDDVDGTDSKHHFKRFAMDDAQISQIIKSLEEEVGKQYPKSHISIGKPPCYDFVTANREGCLEFARVFLKAAIEPIRDNRKTSKAVTLGNLEMQTDSPRGKRDRLFGWVQRREAWPEPEGEVQRFVSETRLRDKIMGFGCFASALVLLALVISGIVYWGRLLSGGIH